MSSSNKHAAFREYFRLNVNVSCIVGELRSLISATFVVLTATTTEGTKHEIFDVY